MAIRPDWTVGMLTLVAGSTDFTTVGSALQSAAVQAGDAIITASGNVLVIASITGENSGTLSHKCPVVAAGTGQPLRIRYQPDGSRYQGAIRDLITQLGNGNLDAFAGLVGRPNAVPMFTGFGTIELVDNELLGGGAGGSWSAIVLDYAGLSAYADKPAGFRVMVIDAGEQRSALFEKLSDNNGDWSQPVYFTGKTGEQGGKGDPGHDFEPDIVGVLADRGRYNGETVGFAFLATDTAQLFFRQGGAGEWSAPIAFGGGKPGENGLSAYQIAVQEGFTGTQQQWLASLHGSDASVTTANVGAAVAAAAGEQAISDADSVAGVKSGTSNMRRWTWGIVKAWIKGWITKDDVGLGNVANTAPADMPVSTAQQLALNAKLGATAQAADSAKLNGKTEAQLVASGPVKTYVDGGSPATCKAWVRFDANGVIASSFNVSSVSRPSTGVFQINFASPMASANYSIVATCRGDTGVSFAFVSVHDDVPTVNNCKISPVRQSNGTAFNSTVTSVAFWG